MILKYVVLAYSFQQVYKKYVRLLGIAFHGIPCIAHSIDIQARILFFFTSKMCRQKAANEL